ncbi:MAG: hypothetical protein Q8L14_39020 [Myxococcales bacterium]|nr:hypothetical protein [Myxococcales bacterium]
MSFASHTPCPELRGLLAPAKAERVMVAVLIELEVDYPLTVPLVGEWLALLIDTGNGITCMAVVCQTMRARLMVSGLALAARRRHVATPIDCFRSADSATRWLNASARAPSLV